MKNKNNINNNNNNEKDIKNFLPNNFKEKNIFNKIPIEYLNDIENENNLINNNNNEFICFEPEIYDENKNYNFEEENFNDKNDFIFPYSLRKEMFNNTNWIRIKNYIFNNNIEE